jgi:hypothetical protein
VTYLPSNHAILRGLDNSIPAISIIPRQVKYLLENKGITLV